MVRNDPPGHCSSEYHARMPGGRKNMTKKGKTHKILDRITIKIRKVLSFHIYKKIRHVKPGHKIVTFTFDDCHETSISRGSKILENYKKNGTYYVSLGLCGEKNANGKFADIGQIEDLIKNGHEIACHTYTHMDCCANNIETVVSDCKNNRDGARSLYGVDMNSFSYPYGNICPSVKKVLSKKYVTSRTVEPGINRNRIDLAALKSVSIYGKSGRTKCIKWLNRLDNKSGWLIFYVHDVMPRHSLYGCSEELLDELIEKSINKKFEILTIGEVIKKYII